jgi:Ca2+-binding RTX toxin-like protein
VVGTFLIGCAFLLLVVGCAGTTSSEPSNKKEEQGSSPQATASEEEARCEGTRTFHTWYIVYPNGQNSSLQSGSAEDMKKAGKKAGKVEEGAVVTTNDLPGCPKGGLLLGTDKPDQLDAKEGDDEIRGLGAKDVIKGGAGSDILYGGAGDDRLDAGYGQGQGEDVIYGGDGNDLLDDLDDQRGKLYCGKGKDRYLPDKIDYVDSSCENTAFGQGA